MDIKGKVSEQEVRLLHSSRGKTKVSTLEALMDFSAILNSSLDTGEVRLRSMNATCRLLECDGATLYLIDEEKNELVFDAIVGSVASGALREIRLPVGEGSIAGWVAAHRKPMFTNEVVNDGRHHKRSDSRAKYKTKNMVCVPVESKGRLLGVLQAVNKHRGNFHEAHQRLLCALSNQVAIAVENALLFESLKTSFFETVTSLASALDAKDRYTGGHTKRVALFSVLISKYMGLTKEKMEEVRMAAVLHDIGKIGVEDKILKKQAQLEGDEWEEMKKHPDYGYRILGHIKGLKTVTDGMRFHHERPDGLGYPLGLKGEEIPLVARIISVADTFDAMTSNRPYRDGLSYEVAFEEIVKHRGSQFDEKVVDAFVKAFTMERMGKKRIK